MELIGCTAEDRGEMSGKEVNAWKSEDGMRL